MVEDIIVVLRSLQRIVITTHIRPDGDAIGSQLALGLFLKQLGKSVTMINAHTVPSTLAWMDGAEDIQVFTDSLAQVSTLLRAEAIVVLDLNAAHRLGTGIGDLVQDTAGIKILIDHHRQPESWFDLSYVREDAAATGELVYALIKAWDEALLRGPVATALYVAIMTDTGQFRYATVTPAVHRIVADVLDRGARKPAEVYAEIYQTHTPEWPRLLGHVMNTLTLRFDGKLAYIVVTRNMLETTSADYQDTEGFVEFAMAVEGVEAALVFSETRKGVKVSFRSKGACAVDGWARSFGGGGHRNAAGAFIRGPLQEIIDTVVKSAPKHISLAEAPVEDELSADDKQYLSILTGI